MALRWVAAAVFLQHEPTIVRSMTMQLWQLLIAESFAVMFMNVSYAYVFSLHSKNVTK